jgi:hypothetical protein
VLPIFPLIDQVIYLWQRTAGPSSFFCLTACGSICTRCGAITGNIWIQWNTRKDSSRTNKMVVLFCLCVLDSVLWSTSCNSLILTADQFDRQLLEPGLRSWRVLTLPSSNITCRTMRTAVDEVVTAHGLFRKWSYLIKISSFVFHRRKKG